MQAISIGHAGILVRTKGVTIVCDPWFVPAFLGSWFVFPRNDQLPDHIMHDVCNPDFLYISHLHADHFDEPFLRNNMSRDTTVLLPGYPTREMERAYNKLGFTKFVRTSDGMATNITNDVSIAIHLETSITDGPGGDSAIVISDGDARLVNQNDCRTNDLDALRQHGPVDLHWLQFSGAIWYPMVYEMDADTKLRLCKEKVASQFSRAMRYVEAIDATHVVPSAGPPCFLDEALFSLNMITGEEPTIFPDQRQFLSRLADAQRNATLTVPGTTFDIVNGKVAVTQPGGEVAVESIFNNKEQYLRTYQRDWTPWLDDLKVSLKREPTNLVETLQLWWKPLLDMAPALRQGIGAGCLLNAGDEGIFIDFARAKIEPYTDQDYAFRFDIDRDLVEHVVAERAVDWSNSLFLSCRFTAWRKGEYNEYLYNFFKSLSVERMTRTETEAKEKLLGPNHTEADIELGDYVVQRRCPHRNADLSVFGEIEDGNLVCTLHGWRFDLETGQCLTAKEKTIRIKKRS
jgi:UDP-MurNAc hydroxylase